MGNYKPWRSTLEINLDDIFSLKFCLQLWEKTFLFLSNLVCSSLLWKHRQSIHWSTPLLNTTTVTQVKMRIFENIQHAWEREDFFSGGNRHFLFCENEANRMRTGGSIGVKNTWEFVKGMMHSWQEKKGNLFPSLYACPLPNASTGWNSHETPPLMKYFIKSFHLFQWQWLNVSHLDVEDRSSVLRIGRRIIWWNSILVRKDHVWV
jgi:hypothetical protein